MGTKILGKVVNLSAALIILVAFAAISFAQSDYGSITGFVRDPSGAVIPNATVTMRDEGTGAERKTTTNESGYYAVTMFR
jgi:hypothetical protein